MCVLWTLGTILRLRLRHPDRPRSLRRKDRSLRPQRSGSRTVPGRPVETDRDRGGGGVRSEEGRVVGVLLSGMRLKVPPDRRRMEELGP